MINTKYIDIINIKMHTYILYANVYKIVLELFHKFHISFHKIKRKLRLIQRK